MKINNHIEGVFKAPAIALEKGVSLAGRVKRALFSKIPFRAAEEYLHTLGPGLTTGAADDDPSGIATYSQTGARYGFQLLWLAIFTFPLMAVIQEMCARIALVTGQGLAANIRDRYAPWVLHLCVVLLFVANTLTLALTLALWQKQHSFFCPRLILFFLSSGLLWLFCSCRCLPHMRATQNT